MTSDINMKMIREKDLRWKKEPALCARLYQDMCNKMLTIVRTLNPFNERELIGAVVPCLGQ